MLNKAVISEDDFNKICLNKLGYDKNKNMIYLLNVSNLRISPLQDTRIYINIEVSGDIQIGDEYGEPIRLRAIFGKIIFIERITICNCPLLKATGIPFKLICGKELVFIKDQHLVTILTKEDFVSLKSLYINGEKISSYKEYCSLIKPILGITPTSKYFYSKSEGCFITDDSFKNSLPITDDLILISNKYSFFIKQFDSFITGGMNHIKLYTEDLKLFVFSNNYKNNPTINFYNNSQEINIKYWNGFGLTIKISKEDIKFESTDLDYFPHRPVKLYIKSDVLKTSKLKMKSIEERIKIVEKHGDEIL